MGSANGRSGLSCVEMGGLTASAVTGLGAGGSFVARGLGCQQRPQKENRKAYSSPSRGPLVARLARAGQQSQCACFEACAAPQIGDTVHR